jgi:Skp family chaperone for outer membrane proteins
LNANPKLFPLCIIIYLLGFTALAALMVLIARGIQSILTADYDAEYAEMDAKRRERIAKRDEKLRALEEKRRQEFLKEQERKKREREEKREKREKEREEKRDFAKMREILAEYGL